MKWSFALFFATYLAQGVQRIGKDYLRTDAARALGGDLRRLQLFCNLLPEFGSLVWTLKPFLMLVVERILSKKSRKLLAAAAALLCAGAWYHAAIATPIGLVFLSCTAFISLGTTLADGIVDGQVAEESVDKDSAAASRYFCECGNVAGGVFVAAIAWLLALDNWMMIMITTACWIAVAPLFIIAPSMQSVGGATKPSRMSETCQKGVIRLNALFGSSALLICVYDFVANLAPNADFFLYRQHVLGFNASQQALVSVASNCGWFLGVWTYRHVIAPCCSVSGALRMGLFLRPVASCFSSVCALLAGFGHLPILLAFCESMIDSCCLAMAFLPVTVLMQLNSPAGCEASTFTFFQWSGAIGRVLGRNLEYQLMSWLGIHPGLGRAGFDGFANLLSIVLMFRIFAVLFLLPVCILLGRTTTIHASRTKEE